MLELHQQDSGGFTYHSERVLKGPGLTLSLHSDICTKQNFFDKNLRLTKEGCKHQGGLTMPLIQISLVKGKSPKYIKAIADGIHAALQTAWKIPEHDRFQVINEYKKSHFHFDKTMWGVKRSDDVILIYITSIKRSLAMKKKLYLELVKVLGKHPKVRKEDIFVSIVQNDKEDWSFGNGVAQILESIKH